MITAKNYFEGAVKLSPCFKQPEYGEDDAGVDVNRRIVPFREGKRKYRQSDIARFLTKPDYSLVSPK